MPTPRMRDVIAALKAARAKHAAANAERAQAFARHRERWALAKEKIADAARRYGREYPGGARALATDLHQDVEGWGGRDPFSGVDPVAIVDRRIRDLLGLRVAFERDRAERAKRQREQAKRAMREYEQAMCAMDSDDEGGQRANAKDA
jgi:hypothetical protein